jgi:hypothetical protein
MNCNTNATISNIYDPKARPKKILLYIAWGDDQIYYDGVIFSYLTFKYWVKKNTGIEFYVLTEKPEKFKNYPINIIVLSAQQKEEWSLNGTYNFRIKNRGMAFVIDKLKLKCSDKIIFMDADTYFNKSPLNLFDLINENQVLLYRNEGLILRKKKFLPFQENLKGRSIKVDGTSYLLSKNSSMWGSLMIGLLPCMTDSLDWADKLMLELLKIIPAHTVEQFALSESLSNDYKMVEGKNYVSLYSSSRMKSHAKPILSNFLFDVKNHELDSQIHLAQSIKIKRSVYVIIKQRLGVFNKH